MANKQEEARINAGKGFVIKKDDVIARLPQETIDFYKTAGYLDVTAGDLYISDIIRRNEAILDNIDCNRARHIVQAVGLQLPTVALMYKVIIPFLKERAPIQSLQSFLAASEFLEDTVIQESHLRSIRNEQVFWEEIKKQPEVRYALTLQIGKGKTNLILPSHKSKDEREFWNYELHGAFDQEDTNAHGFPTTLKENGEFQYWGPSDFNQPIGRELYPFGGGPQGQVAVVRSNEKSLDVLLSFRPSGGVQDKVGARGICVQQSFSDWFNLAREGILTISV